MNRTQFFKKLKALNNGAYFIKYKNRKYLLNKDTLLNNKLIKIYAKELGGNDIVNGNYYTTIKNGILNPDYAIELQYIVQVLVFWVFAKNLRLTQRTQRLIDDFL